MASKVNTYIFHSKHYVQLVLNKPLRDNWKVLAEGRCLLTTGKLILICRDWNGNTGLLRQVADYFIEVATKTGFTVYLKFHALLKLLHFISDYTLLKLMSVIIQKIWTTENLL